eukprot:g6015.t1
MSLFLHIAWGTVAVAATLTPQVLAAAARGRQPFLRGGARAPHGQGCPTEEEEERVCPPPLLPTDFGQCNHHQILNDTYLPEPRYYNCLAAAPSRSWHADARALRREIWLLQLQLPSPGVAGGDAATSTTRKRYRRRGDVVGAIDAGDHTWLGGELRRAARPSCATPRSASGRWKLLKLLEHGYCFNLYYFALNAGAHWAAGIPVLVGNSRYRFGPPVNVSFNSAAQARAEQAGERAAAAAAERAAAAWGGEAPPPAAEGEKLAAIAGANDTAFASAADRAIDVYMAALDEAAATPAPVPGGWSELLTPLHNSLGCTVGRMYRAGEGHAIGIGEKWQYGRGEEEEVLQPQREGAGQEEAGEAK